jgi:hypothetical protein
LESRVGNHIRAVYRFRRVERRGWIFSHLAALFVVFPGHDVSASSQEEQQQEQQQRDECENEEGFKRLLSIGFRIVQ